ncbi:MAG: hypothetical protein KC619_21925 [Myxococcales bacterium]|nr:hypothetical protein [Myxococcales bacterium]
MARSWASFATALLLLQACGDEVIEPTDAGTTADAGSFDAGETDAGGTDAAMVDAGGPTDAGPSDEELCFAADADCGFIDDGRGRAIDCGDCTGAGETCGALTPNRCAVGECVPRTCEDFAITCGSIGDGCDGTLECGTCDAGLTCTEGVCFDAPDTCDDGRIVNECGGCGPTRFPVGSACGCSSVFRCYTGSRLIDQSLAFCDDGDMDGDVARTLPMTDDSVDEYSEVMGMLDVEPAHPQSAILRSNLAQDTDTYEVYVEDVFTGIFGAEVEVVVPTGYTIELCYEHVQDSILGAAYLTCDVGAVELSTWDECCARSTPADTVVRIETGIAGTSALLDNSGTSRIRVEAVDGPADACVMYTVRYRF